MGSSCNSDKEQSTKILKWTDCTKSSAPVEEQTRYLARELAGICGLQLRQYTTKNNLGIDRLTGCFYGLLYITDVSLSNVVSLV